MALYHNDHIIHLYLQFEPRVIEQLFGGASLLWYPSKHPFRKLNEKGFLLPV